MTLKTERRTQNRKRPLSLVYVELPPSNGGMMRDLSEHGFSLRAMMPLRPSEKVPFSFALDTSARIDGEAIVLRVDDGGHVAALEFAGLPSHSRDQIRRWLDRFDEPLPMESTPAQPRESKQASLTELRTRIRAPRPPTPAPPVVESAPSPPIQQAIAPPKPEPSPAPSSPEAEIAPAPTKKVAAPPKLEPPPPTVVAPQMQEPPIPPAAEIPEPTPAPTMMALPKPAPPPPQEAPPPPVSHLEIEEPETSSLPPLLKLSSVRPGPLPTEISEEPAVPVAPTKPVAAPTPRIPIALPKPEPPAAIETRIAEPVPAPPVVPRRVPPPALEPFSSLEGETDSDAPGWMDRFTLGRAIGIMLFLTFLSASYVYHRELGQALIWFGHQIAGDDSSESSKVARPEVPSAAHPIPESSPVARAVPAPALTVQRPTETTEPKSANLPAATDKAPSPQLKNAPGSLVPLTQVTKPPAPASLTDNSQEPGQQEYLEALQILRSPSKASEVPAAIQQLWVAVEKGNTGAEIALAELFRTGKGVARNCDQTRILLSAAARKGSAEARKRLEAFRREGCGN